MAISNKLSNPTPFHVEIPYEKGVVINIPADSSITLTVQQMDDYRPDKPGSEETRKILSEQGVFLEDPELEYDRQAVVALKAAIKAKSSRFREARDRLVEMHVAAGIDANVESPAFQEKLKRMGLLQLQERVVALERRVKLYTEVVGDVEDSLVPTQTRLDPERTCYATDPPREFASKTALAIFLAENPEIAKKHAALIGAETDASNETDSELSF
jgi:hypothetical protein